MVGLGAGVARPRSSLHRTKPRSSGVDVDDVGTKCTFQDLKMFLEESVGGYGSSLKRSISLQPVLR